MSQKRDRINLFEAQVQNRCVCQGCRACRGKTDRPCGQGGLNGEEMCRWCRMAAAKP